MNVMKRLLLPLLALTGCAAAPAGPPPRPAMWSLSDADTTIYIFGTIHLLPSGMKWRTAKFDQAVAKSDGLVLEIVPHGAAEKQAEALRALAYSPGQPPLAERVSPELRPALAAVVAKTGIPPAALDQLETWAAGLALGSATMQSLDVSMGTGVELQLGDSFRDAGKPIEALETVDSQLRLFDSLPEATQRRFLESVIAGDGKANTEFSSMIAAWSSGKLDRIAVTFDNETRQSPELVEALFRRRNATWTAWLRKRLETPGTVMVAVGAGHLAGADSVPAMLAAQGLKLKRIQ
jgi:uncharacterized protein YbaP (TraB family)